MLSGKTKLNKNRSLLLLLLRIVGLNGRKEERKTVWEEETAKMSKAEGREFESEFRSIGEQNPCSGTNGFS